MSSACFAPISEMTPMVRPAIFGLKLLEPLAFGSEEADRQVANPFRDLITQNGERAFAFRRDEHPPARCKIMANDIRDGVSLAGAGRSLHHHAFYLRAFQPPYNGDLFLIESFRKKELLGPGLVRCGFGLFNRTSPSARIRRASLSAKARLREDVGWLVRWLGHKSDCGARQGVGGLNCLSQALKVCRKEIV